MKENILENEYFSDFENENNLVYDDNLDIDEFYFYYSNDIQDIYEELKEDFACSPFFLSKLTFPLLTDFILSFVLKKQFVQNIKKDYLHNFNDFYKVEVETSYNTICNFLKKFKKHLPYNFYLDFCVKFSDLHEVKHNI